MSIDIEKQTLSTLKSWAKALKIKKVSTYDKAQMVELMKSLPPAVLERMLKLQEEQAAEEPETEEPAAEKETDVSGEDTPARTADLLRTARPAARTPGDNTETYIRESTSPEDYTEKTVSVSVVEEDDRNEISGIPDDEKKLSGIRGKYNNISFSRNNRMTGRSGFGTYAESYRAQLEESGRSTESLVRPASAQRASDQTVRPVPSAGTEAPRRPRPAYASGRVPEALRLAAPENSFRRESAPEAPASAAAPASPVSELAEAYRPVADPSADAPVRGRLEILSEMGGFGFIRAENYSSGDGDVYVSPAQIHKFRLKTGDVITGRSRAHAVPDRNAALSLLEKINDETPEESLARTAFEALTPVRPTVAIPLGEARLPGALLPLCYGSRVLVKAAPHSGKTTLLRTLAREAKKQDPSLNVFVLLIDERPEDVTELKEELRALGVQVHYSTFDETPEHHRRVAEMIIGRAQRLVEHGENVLVLLDSLTRLVRAYGVLVNASGRQLACGLDPAAFYHPKRFFGSARCMREGGSLTILATAHIGTGSSTDAAILDEFAGTANKELVLEPDALL